jgi:hypothetical protein
MGLCETKERRYNSMSISTLMKSFHSKDNLNTIKKNDFFYFTELIIKYKFDYIHQVINDTKEYTSYQ